MTPAAIKYILAHEQKLAAEVSAVIEEMESQKQDFFLIVKKKLQLKKMNQVIAELQRDL